MPRNKRKLNTADPTSWPRETRERIYQRILNEQAIERARELESHGWEPWYAEIFGQQFVDVLAPHHREAIAWHWYSVMMKRAGQVVEKSAYFAIWSRGHMKSTIARYIAVCDAALTQNGYCLYVSGTKNKVRGHAISIESLLAGEKLLEYYPRLGVVKRGLAGQSKGWQADFIYTDAGYVFHFISLDEGVAGANIDSIRPTLIIPDDVDDREDSPLISENRLRVLTKAVLMTRQADTLFFWAQNYISRHSVLYAIDTGRQRVLTNRVDTKPIPAVIGLKTEPRTIDGIIHDVIIAGTPTWEFYGLERCQQEIDSAGLSAFLSECQHEVDHDKSEQVIPEFEEAVHLITWEEFNRFYHLSPTNREIPRHWRKYIALDWGSTGAEAGHACVVGYIAIAAQSASLPGTAFFFNFASFPKSVLAGQVARSILNYVLADNQSNPQTYIELGLLDRATNDPGDILANRARDKVIAALDHRNDYCMFHMSHEQKAVRDIFRLLYGLPFQPCNPKRDGGVEQLRHYLRFDGNTQHPFRPDRNGLSRMYMIVADDAQRDHPTGDAGLKLVRDQLPEWRWSPPTLTARGFLDERPLKISDDVGNMLQMIFTHFKLHATPLTSAEEFEAAIPPDLRYATLLANSPFTNGLTPEQELSHLMALREARRKVRGQVERFNDWLEPER